VEKFEPTLGEAAPGTQEPGMPEVLHYLGYNEDAGGVVTVLRALAGTGRFRAVLGMNAGAVQRQTPPLPMRSFPVVEAETISPATGWRARAVARQVHAWLQADPRRVVHTHSRAGLLVALWLHAAGERRVLASVHALGRQTWFYRAAARRLRGRIFWLCPAMKQHYGVEGGSWDDCLPDCIAARPILPPRTTPVSPGQVTLGAVGGFSPGKRWDILIDALAVLPSGIRDRVHLIHAGGDERDPANASCAAGLRRRAASRGVATHIDWRGRLVPIEPLWAQIDCLVVASPVEAFSVAAIEAAAAGVPVIASDRSATRDFIQHCGGGWMYHGDSAQSLAGMIASLVETPRLATWRRNDEGLRRFLAPAAVEAYLAAYQRVLAR
jgi:glycosyltransferase involved in cell wall biosynthesis